MDREASTSYDVLERMLLDESAEPTSLPLSLLQYVTNHFSLDNQIGSGGFAVVYKGMVGKGMVAVKKLSNTFGLHENKFHEEVKCLINAKHKNIVRFLGYCAETQGKMQKFEGKLVMADQRNWLLCFEYVCNGSLDKHITDATCGLNWSERYQIIRGITEGLLFLHEMRILHLDLKPANILLDGYMVPKIADFGLSRCLSEDQTRAITENLRGTLGYMDPEYIRLGQITFASDIYSLGIIIMEILTGVKQYLDDDYVVESWMNQLDASEGRMQLEQVRVCSKIGIECMNLDPKKRPVARHIIDRLDKTTSADYSEETCVGSSSFESQISLPREQFGERIGKLGAERLHKADVKEHSILEDFSKEEMERMVKDAQKYKEQDKKHKKNVQARNDFQTLLFTISNNVKNLQDSAAILLVQMEATHEQDLQTPGHQDTRIRNSTRQVHKPHKAFDKMMQAHNDTVNKLQHSIMELQETADGSANCIERKERTTNQIIGQMEQIEGDYKRIRSQIENIQARNNILNLLFTISNNMKNLEDSATRLFIHPEATREQDLQTPRFQDTRARNSTSQVYKPHMIQDKDNRQMVQAQNKLYYSIKQLQDTADGTKRWLENKELTTNQIIVQMEEIKGDYNIISSQIENIQARNNIKNLLFTISNNMKNLEDSAPRLFIHPEASREQDLRTPRFQDTKKLYYIIKQLQDMANGTKRWLENKELTTNRIIVQMEEIKGDYNILSSHIENIQALNDIKNL